jgi:hypothetical protein
MGMKWYYAENGERAGPATREEIVKLIERDDAQPVLIWAEGLAGSADGISAEAEAAKAPETKKATLARRARNELIEYLTIAAYLAVCFGALLLYKAAILDSEGVDTTRAGLAIVKALILGKFVLMLEHFKVGHGKKSARVLVLNIVKKALVFTFLLFLLTVAEDVIIGYFHGADAWDAVKGIGGGTRLQALATALLMFLVLIPYFAYRDIAAAIGEETLSKLLFIRQPMPNRLHANPS